mgnify:CR=1 FL=1
MARVKKGEETMPGGPGATGQHEEGNPTISWERPSGFSITTVYNEATIAYALENGWKPLSK